MVGIMLAARCGREISEARRYAVGFRADGFAALAVGWEEEYTRLVRLLAYLCRRASR